MVSYTTARLNINVNLDEIEIRFIFKLVLPCGNQKKHY